MGQDVSHLRELVLYAKIVSQSFLNYFFCNILSNAAENVGKAVLGGGCLAGIGALCYYGLGLSNQVGAIDKAR